MTAKEILNKKNMEILNKKNVVGVGNGKKIVKGKRTDHDCVTVMVSQKVSLHALSAEDTIPLYTGGLWTDVVEVGTLRALATPTDRWRPAPGGVSIGHYAISAGTLGVVVRYRPLGARLILSNNHVLANCNDATEGDEILQPGPYDGGIEGDLIARLERFIPIVFGTAPPACGMAKAVASICNALAWLFGSSHRLHAVKISAGTNRVDAAVAMPLADGLVSDEILGIGRVNGWTEDVHIGMAVKKSGRTTGLTEGEVQILDAMVNVQYGEGRTAIFTGQMIAGPMSQPGDSGSLVVDSQDRAVGLLFAGSDQITIFNPIKDVLSLLDIEIPAVPSIKKSETRRKNLQKGRPMQEGIS